VVTKTAETCTDWIASRQIKKQNIAPGEGTAGEARKLVERVTDKPVAAAVSPVAPG
jgi:hypothetical protein